MKRLGHIIKTIYVIAIGMLFQSNVKAETIDPVAYMDSVEFSLITCSPHEEIYSLYGHSALRVHDLHQGHEEDVSFNWGVFNYHTPYFVPRFIFGLTDYELGIAPFQAFCKYYQHWGSGVIEQVLDLTSEEKLALHLALKENYMPQNRVYRYNYFYDNCSTRPRDIVERSVNGSVVYAERKDYEPTFREIVHENAAHHRWTLFGIDMLLGLKADLKTTRVEQEFLPANMLYDFDHAQISDGSGNLRPLVKERRMPVNPGVQVVESDVAITPTVCAIGLLLFSLALFLLEWRRRKTFKYWDAALMVLLGLPGCVLTLMIFSQHPTTNLNLELLLVNPVHLFFLPAVLRRRKTRYWPLLAVMVALYMLGAFFQRYAEGMLILASCLLLRIWIHYKNEK